VPGFVTALIWQGVRSELRRGHLIGQLHAEGKPVAAIARMVGLTRKTVYRAIRGQEQAA
jgi:hypothetical protein